MKTVSGKKFSRILERNGWSLLRISGSHFIYGKPGSTSGFRCRYMVISR